MIQDGPKILKDGLQMASRWPQDGFKIALDTLYFFTQTACHFANSRPSDPRSVPVFASLLVLKPRSRLSKSSAWPGRVVSHSVLDKAIEIA